MSQVYSQFSLISDAPLTNIYFVVKFRVALREYESAILIAGGAGITVTLVLLDDIEADAYAKAGRTVRGQEESSLHGVSVPSVEFFPLASVVASSFPPY